MERLTQLAAMTLLLVLAVSCRRNEDTPPAPKPTGELIQSSASEAPTNEPPQRKHPKPPSVQRRMVLAELTVLGQSNGDNSTLASGTLGTSADLARTNLPSITSMALPELKVSGYQTITFTTLAGFDFTLSSNLSDKAADSEIPPDVRALNNGKVAIEGFLLPVRMNDGLAVEFLLMRNQSMCCYGVPPKINEWITVQVNGKGVQPVMDQPVAVAGVLHVGAMDDNGSLSGIYRLDADTVVAPF